MNIQAQKAIIIEQFKQIDDIDLIKTIKSLLDNALTKKQNSYDIPESHQDLVMERFDKVREEPARLLNWDKAKKSLEPDEKI
jgi:hypothetical protein